MRVAVFGGSGFVGSHVVDALTERGHEVVIFDLQPSRYLSPRQTMVVGDILDDEAVRRAVTDCEVVYQFAGLADLDACRTQPVATVRANILGTVILLDACASARVNRFIYASTIYVYSASGGFYRASKQACEAYIEEFHQQFGLNFSILRYGTLYGRRADQRNSVHRFLRAAVEARKIVYPGTGDEIREYIHVADAARCSVDILAPEFENQHVILTGHHAMRVRDLMVMIQEIVGTPLEIIFKGDGSGSEIGHYQVTPYSFRPKIARKLVSSYYLDMGQGLLDCLEELVSPAGSEAPSQAAAAEPTQNRNQGVGR